MRILYVEDDQTIALTTAKQLFLHTNHVVTVCQTISSAIRIIDKYAKNVDVIILDLRLPDGYGFELIHRMEHANINIPIIVTSGYCGEFSYELERCERLKIIKCALAKPFTLGKLLDQLKLIEKSTSRE